MVGQEPCQRPVLIQVVLPFGEEKSVRAGDAGLLERQGGMVGGRRVIIAVVPIEVQVLHP